MEQPIKTMTGGNVMKPYAVPVKRYVQTMDLKDEPALIAEYRKRHSEGEAWPEILAGIREVGILEMDIYILGTRLVMIVLRSACCTFSECSWNVSSDDVPVFCSVFATAASRASILLFILAEACL